jgi:hypothetical protein
MLPNRSGDQRLPGAAFEERNGPLTTSFFGWRNIAMNDKPTQEQLAEIKKLSSEARVPDESEFVTSKEEAEIRIRDLKEKARME